MTAILALLPDWQIAVSLAAVAVTVYAIIAAHRRLAAVAGQAEWNISDLFTEFDPATEKRHLTPRRLAHVIGVFGGLVAFLRLMWNATIGDGFGVVLLFFAFCAVYMFPETAERVIGNRLGGGSPNGAASVPPKTGA